MDLYYDFRSDVSRMESVKASTVLDLLPYPICLVYKQDWRKTIGR